MGVSQCLNAMLRYLKVSIRKIAIDHTNYRTMLAHYFGIENIEIKTFDQP